MAKEIQKKKKKNRKEHVKPNFLAWFLLTTFSKILLFFSCRIKCDGKEFKNRNKKEGSILIHTHMSNKDHFIVCATTNYTRVNFVITKYYTYFPIIALFLRIVRAIPREQFRSDMLSIRKMKKVVDNGGTISIAPAGQTTLHGEVPFIDPVIVKLLKLCKVDVYTMQTTGAYRAYPKWRRYDHDRKAKVTSKIIKTLSKEEIATLSDEEIYQRVYDSLNISEHTNNDLHPTKVKGKYLIEGLENALYVCPKCHQKYTYHSKFKEMTCSNCGNTIVMDDYAKIHGKTSDDICFENESKWYYWQADLMEERLSHDDFIQQNNFYLYRNLRKQKLMEQVGEGVLTITKDRLYYDGTMLNETIHKEFAFDSLIQLPFRPSHHFEIPDGEGTYQFRPADSPATVVEWVQIVDVMNTIKRSKAEKHE